MTDYYVRPAGGGPYGDGSGVDYDNAYDGFASAPAGIQVGGNKLIVAGPHAEAFSIAGAGNSSADFFVTGDYPADPGSITVSGASALGIFVNKNYLTIQKLSIKSTSSHPSISIIRSSYLTFEDIMIDSPGQHGVFIRGNDGDIYTDLTFRRVRVANTPASQRALWWNCVAAGATSTMTNLTIDDCDFSYCYRGIDLNIGADANAASIMTNVVITDNDITYSENAGIFINRGHNVAGANKSLTLTGNNSSHNGTGGSGAGCLLHGFGSPTDKYGDVTVSGNTFNHNQALGGGVNIFDCRYIRVFNNTCSHNTVQESDQYDGAGILLDNGNDEVEIYQNTCSFNTGAPNQGASNNSGAAIQVLKSSNVRMWSNRGEGNRQGVMIGRDPNFGPPTNLVIAQNVFKECLVNGVQQGSDGTSIELKSNIFTGKAGEANTGYREDAATVDSDEDYNVFYGFETDAVNHTLGPKTLTTTDPLLDEQLRPRNQDLAEAGVSVAGVLYDFNHRRFSNPPSIGAHEIRLVGKTINVLQDGGVIVQNRNTADRRRGTFVGGKSLKILR